MKFLILISLVYLVVAEEDLMEVPGKCPEVPVMSNIDHSKVKQIPTIYNHYK